MTNVTFAMSADIEAFATPLLAQALGEFKKENINAIFTNATVSDGLTELVQGKAQIQVAGVTAASLNAINQGVNVRYVADTHFQTDASNDGLWVTKDVLNSDGTLNPKKIKGMKIAFGTGGVGTPTALPVETLLQKSGHTINDVTSVPLGGADQVLALENGSVQGAYLNAPFSQDPKLAACCKLVTPKPPLASGIYLATQEFLSSQPQVAEAVFRALIRTNRTYLQGDYHQNQSVMQALSAATNTPVATIASAPPLRFDPNLSLDASVIQPIQDMWLKVGGVLNYTKPIPNSKIVDTAPVQAALKSS